MNWCASACAARSPSSSPMRPGGSPPCSCILLGGRVRARRCRNRPCGWRRHDPCPVARSCSRRRAGACAGRPLARTRAWSPRITVAAWCARCWAQTASPSPSWAWRRSIRPPNCACWALSRPPDVGPACRPSVPVLDWALVLVYIRVRPACWSCRAGRAGDPGPGQGRPRAGADAAAAGLVAPGPGCRRQPLAHAGQVGGRDGAGLRHRHACCGC